MARNDRSTKECVIFCTCQRKSFIDVTTPKDGTQSRPTGAAPSTRNVDVFPKHATPNEKVCFLDQQEKSNSSSTCLVITLNSLFVKFTTLWYLFDDLYVPPCHKQPQKSIFHPEIKSGQNHKYMDTHQANWSLKTRCVKTCLFTSYMGVTSHRDWLALRKL